MNEYSEKKTVLCICINYYVEEETALLVSDFLTQNSHHILHFIVLDNSQTIRKGDRIAQLAGNDSRLHIFTPERNLGYLGGAQYALDMFTRKNDVPDFIIVSNPDIRIKDPYFISRLCNIDTQNDSLRVGMIAPTIVSDLTEGHQNPYMINRPSRARMFFRKCMFLWYPISMFYQSLAHLKASLNPGRRKRGGQIHKGRIYAGHGAFMIFTKDYFRLGGNLKHGVFLFGEEIFLAEKILRLGLLVWYYPVLEVHHAEHATTGFFKTRKMFRYQKEAVNYCYTLFGDKN